MSESELRMSGLLCEGCGACFDDELAPGHPRRCNACDPHEHGWANELARFACACVLCAGGDSVPRMRGQCHGWYQHGAPCCNDAMSGELLCEEHAAPQSPAIMALQREAAKLGRRL